MRYMILIHSNHLAESAWADGEALALGPDAGLKLLDILDRNRQLAEYHLLPATRADLLRRGRRFADALPRYLRAFELALSDPERRFLRRRIDETREAVHATSWTKLSSGGNHPTTRCC